MQYLGNVNSIFSEGTNELIKEGAKLYTNINDLEWFIKIYQIIVVISQNM